MALNKPTPFDDILKGTNAADVISGLAGDDQIYGRGGPDTIDGDPGADWLYGGAGRDTIRGGTGPDQLFGGAGNDILDGGGGGDSAYGGAGDDRYLKSDATSFDGFEGGPGIDWIDLSGFTDSRGAFVALSLNDIYVGTELTPEFMIMGTLDVENAIGSRFADTMVASALGSRLEGAGGDDRLYGGDANDVLIGGRGSDELGGGAGDDVMIGGSGADIFRGYLGGNDIMRGNGGNDLFTDIDGAAHIYGGNGRDTFVFTVGDTFDGTTIGDFRIGRDKLDLTQIGIGGPNTLAGVMSVATTIGAGGSAVTEIDFGGKSVFLEGIDKADFVPAMFDFF